jgi:hypothetical protein
VKPGTKPSHRWLDSLALWSVGGRDDAPAPAAHGDVSVVAGGTTRRTALRTVAGAGAFALFAPTRLLQPAIAGAEETTPLDNCILDNYATVYKDLKACTKTPIETYDDLSESIAIDENYLRKQKKPAARRRLKKNIERAMRERARAEKAVDFCNALFLEERAVGEAKCQASNPAGGGGGGGTGGCEPGYLLCGDHCCNTNNAYCQGCSKGPTCCRIDANCCPGG